MVQTRTPPHSPSLVASDVGRASPVEVSSAARAAAGMRAFAHRLLSEHPELRENGNAVLSAASIATAFAMLRAGATGETADQIDRVLGFPPSDLGPAFNYLTEQWRPAGRADGPELVVANSLFAPAGLELKEPFLDALARDFGAGVRTVDFAGDAAAIINEWVRVHTRDRIRRLFDRLPPGTRLVLANAIYLQATWSRPFRASATREATFRRASGRLVRVPFMHQVAYVDHAAGDGWSAVRLAYVGDALSMWVLLPAGSADPVALLDPQSLDAARASAAPTEVEVVLPKWDLGSGMPLTGVLPAMGMERAFTRAAEFRGITDEELAVSEVVHRADITVDEEGTEAAAATGIAMIVSSRTSAPRAVFRADRPFAFAVLHDATGAPLFEGVVGDPSVTR